MTTPVWAVREGSISTADLETREPTRLAARIPTAMAATQRSTPQAAEAVRAVVAAEAAAEVAEAGLAAVAAVAVAVVDHRPIVI